MHILYEMLLMAVVFMPAEYLFSFYPIVTGRHEQRQNALLLLFNTYVTAFFITGAMFALYAALDRFVPVSLQQAVSAQPYLLQVIEAIVLMDLGVYVSHRLSHSRLFWPFHEVHHSAEEMSWLVGFRFHPLDLSFYAICSLLPSVLLGFSMESLAAAKIVIAWHAVATHANIRFDVGPLRYFIVGTRFHHWHHANEKEAYDRNFGGFFVFWDWIFGTLHRPERDRAENFGTTGSKGRGIVDLLAGPFRRRRRQQPAPAEIADPVPHMRQAADVPAE